MYNRGLDIRSIKLHSLNSTVQRRRDIGWGWGPGVPGEGRIGEGATETQYLQLCTVQPGSKSPAVFTYVSSLQDYDQRMRQAVN